MDVVIPASGLSLPHRVFTVYAPCDPDADDLSRQFWLHLKDVVCQTTSSWSLFGDFNATLVASERAADNSYVRRRFTDFLIGTKGTDLWQQNHHRNRFIDWTSHGWQSNKGGNIIDRVVVSGSHLVDSNICMSSAWIPGTDHRMIVANVVLKAGSGEVPGQGKTQYVPFKPVPQPRVKYPQKLDKYKFKVFADAVDQLILADDQFYEGRISDDASYIKRYGRLTAIIEQAAVSTFG